MEAGSVTCALFGRVTAGVNADRIRRDWDFEWRRSTATGDSRFSVDIPLPAGPVDLGLALDGIARRDQPVLRALSRESSIDLDIALWFGASNQHPAVFEGDWLSACGRAFDIWAGIVIPADLVAALASRRVTVALRGERRQADRDRLVSA